MLREAEETSNAILAQMQIIAYTLSKHKVARALKGVWDKRGPRLIAEIGDIRRVIGRICNSPIMINKTVIFYNIWIVRNNFINALLWQF